MMFDETLHGMLDGILHGMFDGILEEMFNSPFDGTLNGTFDGMFDACCKAALGTGHPFNNESSVQTHVYLHM